MASSSDSSSDSEIDAELDSKVSELEDKVSFDNCKEKINPNNAPHYIYYSCWTPHIIMSGTWSLLSC